MLVQNISERARKNLLALGFKLVEFGFTDSLRGFGTIRFKPAADFLRDNKVFRYVICTDMRDVVYQRDPSPWLEQHLSPHRLLGCSEGLLIKNEVYNDQWVKQAFPEEHSWLKELEVCNSGAIVGDAEIMQAVFERIYDISLRSTEATGAFLDQGLWNYVLRTSPFKEVSRISKTNESFFASCNWFLVHDEGRTAESTHGHKWIDEPPVLCDGLIYPKGKSEPYAIVHQYDRDSQWYSAIAARYLEKSYPEKSEEPKARRSLRWKKRS